MRLFELLGALWKKNILAQIVRAAKTFLVFQPPSIPTRFVLSESNDDHSRILSENAALTKATAQHETLLRQARRLSAFMEKLRAALANGESLPHLDELKKNYYALAMQQAELSPNTNGLLPVAIETWVINR